MVGNVFWNMVSMDAPTLRRLLQYVAELGGDLTCGPTAAWNQWQHWRRAWAKPVALQSMKLGLSKDDAFSSES